MELGLALPQFDWSVAGEDPLRWETVATWARAAEEAGLSSVWLADHLTLSLGKYGGPAREADGFGILAALGGLARVTSRVRLGSLVLCAPLWPPAVLAQSLAGLDVLSAGRLVVGVGAGWHEPDFAAAGVPFERPGVRLEQLAETVQVLTGMLTGEQFSFAGRHVHVPGARCRPAPVQRPRPPVWIGGRGDRLLDVVARHADGWNTVWTWTPATYRERLDVLERACERVGRDLATVTLSVGLYTLIGEDEADLARRFAALQAATPAGVLDGIGLDDWREGHLVGTVDEVSEQMSAWAALGVSEVIAGLAAVPFAVRGLHPGDDLDLLAAAWRGRREPLREPGRPPAALE